MNIDRLLNPVVSDVISCNLMDPFPNSLLFPSIQVVLPPLESIFPSKRQRSDSYHLTTDQVINLALPIFLDHGVVKVALFGSFARNQQNLSSDIDFIIDFNHNPNFPITMTDFLDVKNQLETLLKRDVDLIEFRTTSDRFMKRIANDLLFIIPHICNLPTPDFSSNHQNEQL